MQLIPIPVLINGHSYEWADIQLSIAGGLPVMGITEINFGYSRKIVNVYGAGSEPVSRGYGQKEYDASITMKMEEVETLIAIAPNNDVTQIPAFSIVVAWLDAENINVVKVLKNCKFMDNNLKSKAGDQSTDITMKLIYAGLF